MHDLIVRLQAREKRRPNYIILSVFSSHKYNSKHLSPFLANHLLRFKEISRMTTSIGWMNNAPYLSDSKTSLAADCDCDG